MSESVQKEPGVCGIANIPNQVHTVASHTHFDFNILLMGEVSVGKTSFINRVLGIPAFQNDLPAFFGGCAGREVGIRVREQYCIENDVHATIRLIDAPQVGYSALCQYTQDQAQRHLEHEADLNRSTAPYNDPRVHVCLYFLTPSQQDALTNVILVAAKADMLSTAELGRLSKAALSQCQECGIQLFDDKLYPISSRPNTLSITDESLEKLLISKHLPRLIEGVQSHNYEQFRAVKATAGNQLIRPLESLTIQHH